MGSAMVANLRHGATRTAEESPATWNNDRTEQSLDDKVRGSSGDRRRQVERTMDVHACPSMPNLAGGHSWTSMAEKTTSRPTETVNGVENNPPMPTVGDAARSRGGYELEVKAEGAVGPRPG